MLTPRRRFNPVIAFLESVKLWGQALISCRRDEAVTEPRDAEACGPSGSHHARFDRDTPLPDRFPWRGWMRRSFRGLA